MKFLIFGFGNIAQRHFRNLKKILPDCLINVYTHRYDDHRIFDDDLNITYTSNLKSEYPINAIFFDIYEALNAEEYDAILVCSLPPERFDIAIKSAHHGFNLFIEKPIAINTDGMEKLKDVIKEKKNKVAVGYQMRFHPIINDIKKYISSNKVGEIYRIEITHGNGIKNWTKGRKLSDFYALVGSKGGGVILSQIHEIDYLNWITDDSLYPLNAQSFSDSFGDAGVEINVSILGSVILDNNPKMPVPVVINLDFINPVSYRKITIFGKKGMIECDLISNDILFKGKLKCYDVKWNDLFLNEMKAFISLLNGKKDDRLATLNDGIVSLEQACYIKDML